MAPACSPRPPGFGMALVERLRAAGMTFEVGLAPEPEPSEPTRRRTTQARRMPAHRTGGEDPASTD